MLGLNLDCRLLLSTVIEHAAITFGDTELVSHSRMETMRSTYRQVRASEIGDGYPSTDLDSGK